MYYPEDRETCSCCIGRAETFAGYRYLEALGMCDHTYETELEARYAPLVAEKSKKQDGQAEV